MQRFAVLQSGLLSYPHTDLVLPKIDPIQDTVNSVLQGKTRTNETSKYHYDKTISDLYEQYNDNPRLLLDFDYREKILTVALRAFSNGTLDGWVEMQKKSEFFTMLHKEFIIDTLQYLCTGRRRINIETWPFLLEVRQATIKDRDFPFPYGDYFSDNAYDYYRDSGRSDMIIKYIDDVVFTKPENPLVEMVKITGDIRYVLSRWTSIENGFSDLIQTLNVIFGRKEVR